MRLLRAQAKACHRYMVRNSSQTIVTTAKPSRRRPRFGEIEPSQTENGSAQYVEVGVSMGVFCVAIVKKSVSFQNGVGLRWVPPPLPNIGPRWRFFSDKPSFPGQVRVS